MSDAESGQATASWVRPERKVSGVTRFRAELRDEHFCSHSHDSYAISLTEWGIQEFEYRGSVHRSFPGQVSILHPGESHDGRPGSVEGFGYCSVHLDPVAIHDAVRALTGAAAPLPLVREPVRSEYGFAHQMRGWFVGDIDSLSAEFIVLSVAQLLITSSGSSVARTKPVNVGALDAVAEYLRANVARNVHSAELETISGMSRFELAAQFRKRYGTSPHRYLLMRRLDLASSCILSGAPLVEAASETGFADQSHMTRVFKATYGFTPGRWSQLASFRKTFLPHLPKSGGNENFQAEIEPQMSTH